MHWCKVFTVKRSILILFSVLSFVKEIRGNCSCNIQAIPGCCNDECGDYCFEDTCEPYEEICSDLYFSQRNCSCIFTNCPNGTERCSGYISCENPYQMCGGVPVMVNGIFCLFNDSNFVNSVSVNYDVKICNLTAPNNQMNSSSPSSTLSVHPSFVPSVIPSFPPSVIPSFPPSVIPSFAPSLVPFYVPNMMPSFAPSLAQTVSLSSTHSPTTEGRLFIDVCEVLNKAVIINSVSPPTASTRLAVFTVQQYLDNSTASQFNNMSDSRVSFTHTVQCVLSGKYSIRTVHVNITSISTVSVTNAANAVRNERNLKAKMMMSATQQKLEANEAALSYANLLYTITFFSPTSDNMLDFFYDGLTSQLSASVADGSFTTIFQEYLAISNNTTTATDNNSNNWEATIPPVFSKPYLLSISTVATTVQPSHSPTSGSESNIQSSSSGTSISNQLAIIVGSVMIAVCALCTIVGFYCVFSQHKQQKEKEIAKWSAHKEVESSQQSSQSSSRPSLDDEQALLSHSSSRCNSSGSRD